VERESGWWRRPCPVEQDEDDMPARIRTGIRRRAHEQVREALLHVLDRCGELSGARGREVDEARMEEAGGVVREEGGDERAGVGGEGRLGQVRREGI
jgi:hypothetical protein